MRNLIALLILAFLPVATSNAGQSWQVNNADAPVNTEYHEAFSAVTSDGLTLFISSDRPGGYGVWERDVNSMIANYDIYVAHRESLDAPWGPLKNLGPKINSSASEHSPMLSPNAHYLYFVSTRPGGYGGDDIYMSYREDVADDQGWEQPVNLGDGVNGPYIESCPVIYFSEDSTYLFYIQFADPNVAPNFMLSELDTDTNTFMASRTVEISTDFPDGHLDPWHGLIWGIQYPGGLGGSDLWQTERSDGADDFTRGWTAPVNLGPEINTEYEEQMPSAITDGSRLFFSSDRPGGLGGMDIYEASRD